ncbi:MAG: small ribosomal subunit biogenesis GTPase RsgA [Gammaproteobacteria bacterium]|nr:small ribosomal subunit biogenesis GTPase RsgA [Gammaproteobacteria bacterium]
MARKLSQQQNRRINSKFEKTLIGSTASKEAVDSALGPEQSGLVISHHGHTIYVEAPDGRHFHCHVRRNLGSIVVGDRVIWQAQTEANEACGVIIAKEPRRSLLIRASQYKPAQELAANIDQVMVVLSLFPTPIPYFLDQHLVAAELQNIPCRIVMNKLDLQAEHPAPEWLEYYKSIGYPIIYASTKTQDGLAELNAEMQGKISILVGQSGVGKSSLINALIDGSEAKTGSISELNKKGRHTTAASCLYHMQNGGSIIDSPGVREFGISETRADKIIDGFIEIKSYLGQCKYRNCSHQNEAAADCAILSAVAAGNIAATRIHSLNRILDELKAK